MYNVSFNNSNLLYPNLTKMNKVKFPLVLIYLLMPMYGANEVQINCLHLYNIDN